MKQLTTLLGISTLLIAAACGGEEDAGMSETDEMTPSSEMMGEQADTMMADTMMEEGMPGEMMDDESGMMDDESGMMEDESGGGEMGGNLLPPGSASSANAAQVNRRIAAALQDNPDEVKRLFRTWVQQQGAA